MSPPPPTTESTNPARKANPLNQRTSTRWSVSAQRRLGTLRRASGAATVRPHGTAQLADRYALPARTADRLRGMDGHARGSLPRAPRVLRTQEQDVRDSPRAQVLLSIHVRVLLQPLGHGAGTRDDALSSA